MTDAEFLEELRSYCEFVQETDKPIVPIFYSASGAIKRERTLGVPAFDGMTAAKKESLLK